MPCSERALFVWLKRGGVRGAATAGWGTAATECFPPLRFGGSASEMVRKRRRTAGIEGKRKRSGTRGRSRPRKTAADVPIRHLLRSRPSGIQPGRHQPFRGRGGPIDHDRHLLSGQRLLSAHRGPQSAPPRAHRRPRPTPRRRAHRRHPPVPEPRGTKANHESTVESPSGLDRTEACTAPRTTTSAPGIEGPASHRDPPARSRRTPTQEKRAVRARLGWSSATA